METEYILIGASIVFFLLYVLSFISEKKQTELYSSSTKIKEKPINSSIDHLTLINDRSNNYFQSIKVLVEHISILMSIHKFFICIAIFGIPLLLSIGFISVIFYEVKYLHVFILYVYLTLIALKKAKTFRNNKFLDEFCDSLMLLNQSISSGQGVLEAFSFAAENSHAKLIKKEFNKLVNDINTSLNFEVVIDTAIRRFPLPEYAFFLVAVNSNFLYGSEIRPVIRKVTKIIVNNRNIDKKKYSLTAEARLSSKIVACIPLAFWVFMRFFRKDDFHFLMNDPTGTIVFYYVLGSVLSGLFINWLLVRRVR